MKKLSDRDIVAQIDSHVPGAVGLIETDLPSEECASSVPEICVSSCELEKLWHLNLRASCPAWTSRPSSVEGETNSCLQILEHYPARESWGGDGSSEKDRMF